MLITLFRELGLDYNLLLVLEQLLSALLKTRPEMKGSAFVQRGEEKNIRGLKFVSGEKHFPTTVSWIMTTITETEQLL